MVQHQDSSTVVTLLESVAERAKAAGVFDTPRVDGGRVVADAAGAAEPAEYRVDVEGDEIWVSLVTANRWLSESIESDLLHSGDKLNELLDEEMVDVGWDLGPITYEHFRSDDMLFTFRSKMPFGPDHEAAAASTTLALLGYEQCFRELGDMTEDEDD